MDTQLDLRATNMTPLSEKELMEISGGIGFLIPLGIAVGISFIRDFGDFRKGLSDGYDGTPLSDDCTCI